MEIIKDILPKIKLVHDIEDTQFAYEAYGIITNSLYKNPIELKLVNGRFIDDDNKEFVGEIKKLKDIHDIYWFIKYRVKCDMNEIKENTILRNEYGPHAKLFESNGDSNNPVSQFIDNNVPYILPSQIIFGVCEHISILFKYCCDVLGIKCATVILDTVRENIKHSLNICSQDKKIYVVDVTNNFISHSPEEINNHFEIMELCPFGEKSLATI